MSTSPPSASDAEGYRALNRRMAETILGAEPRPERAGRRRTRRLRARAGLDPAALDQLADDDVALDLVGALADDHQGRVAEVALDVELGGVAVAAVHADRAQRHLHGRLGA